MEENSVLNWEVISPELGPVSDAEVVRTVLEEPDRGQDYRSVTFVWSQAKTLRVKRMWPVTTSTGKLLSLHIQKVR
jgi:hypothetical protein